MAEAKIGARGSLLGFAFTLALSLTVAVVGTVVQYIFDLPFAAVAWPGVAIAAAAVVLALEQWKTRRGDRLLQRARLYRAIARFLVRAKAATSDCALAVMPDLHTCINRTRTRIAAAASIAADHAAASALEAAFSSHARIALAPRAQKSSLRTAGGPGGRDG